MIWFFSSQSDPLHYIKWALLKLNRYALTVLQKQGFLEGGDPKINPISCIKKLTSPMVGMCFRNPLRLEFVIGHLILGSVLVVD